MTSTVQRRRYVATPDWEFRVPDNGFANRCGRAWQRRRRASEVPQCILRQPTPGELCSRCTLPGQPKNCETNRLAEARRLQHCRLTFPTLGRLPYFWNHRIVDWGRIWREGIRREDSARPLDCAFHRWNPSAVSRRRSRPAQRLQLHERSVQVGRLPMGQ